LNGTVAAQGGQKRGPNTPSNPRRLTTDPCNKVVQEYNFSPGGATYQREEQRFNLRQVTHLRLTIVPNKSGSGTATLTALRLFA
jgi:hypothetical protein